MSDNGIRCPIKQLQLDRVYRICREFIILNKAGIHKPVSGTGVNKCRNAERRVRNKQGGQGNMERAGIRKSGHVELDNLGKGTERVNAVLRLCRGLGTAQSFFESKDSLALAWMAQALALEVDDEDFGQSFAEHAQVVAEAALSFLQGQLFVFAKLVSDGCGVSGGGLRFVGLLVFVKLVVLVAVVGFVTARSLIFLVVGFVAFVVRFVVIVVGLVLSGAGFFAEAFPLMGINVMCKGLHLGECWRLPLLTHNVFNAFGESRIVAVPEDTFIPAGADSKTVEFDIILYNMLVIMRFEVINSVLSIGSGVYRTKLIAESLDKIGPIIKPIRNFIGVKEGWLKEFQGSPSEIGKCEGHLVRVIRVDRIAVEKEITKENEVVELSGFRTVKGIRFLGLSFLDRRVMMAELLGHEHNCFS